MYDLHSEKVKMGYRNLETTHTGDYGAYNLSPTSWEIIFIGIIPSHDPYSAKTKHILKSDTDHTERVSSQT